MDTFSNLPNEKKERIITAAQTAFGRNGYKKASIQDIATAAEISKAMLFHYFGSKKALYIFLVNHSTETVAQEIETRFGSGVTDFFEQAMLIAEMRIAIMNRQPALLSFLKSIYNETASDVADDIERILSEARRPVVEFGVISEPDVSPFKPDVDPRIASKLLTAYIDSLFDERAWGEGFEPEWIMRDMRQCTELLRNHFYKK